MEVVTAIEKHSFVRHGDADLYASMASNSESLLLYDEFEFAQVESLYMFNTIDSPGSAWLHVQGPKITMITQCVDYPPFTLQRHMEKFRHLEGEYPGLKISYEPYAQEEHRTKSLLLFLDHIDNPETHLPQIFLL